MFHFSLISVFVHFAHRPLAGVSGVAVVAGSVRPVHVELLGAAVASSRSSPDIVVLIEDDVDDAAACGSAFPAFSTISLSMPVLVVPVPHDPEPVPVVPPVHGVVEDDEPPVPIVRVADVLALVVLALPIHGVVEADASPMPVVLGVGVAGGGSCAPAFARLRSRASRSSGSGLWKMGPRTAILGLRRHQLQIGLSWIQDWA